MSPADRSQCHRQPHHHREVRDYPDTPLRFQIFIFKMFVIFIYICTILVQTFIKCWNLEFLDFPDVPVLVIPATILYNIFLVNDRVHVVQNVWYMINSTKLHYCFNFLLHHAMTTALLSMNHTVLFINKQLIVCIPSALIFHNGSILHLYLQCAPFLHWSWKIKF